MGTAEQSGKEQRGDGTVVKGSSQDHVTRKAPSVPISHQSKQEYSQTFSAANLPTPRLELAWLHTGGSEYECEYVLVLGLKEHDVRIPEEKGDGETPVREARIEIGRTRSTRGRAPDWEAGVIDPPFRDGAHAKWDASQLGGIPIFVTYNGRAMRLQS